METTDQIVKLLNSRDGALFTQADVIKQKYYGNDVYIRGIIEFSNYCVRNCKYCGLRRDNDNVRRYRMSADEIMIRVSEVYGQGIKTIVLQSGDDLAYTRDDICDIIYQVKKKHPDMAVTLSIGERPLGDYKAFFESGADRYLLKHETMNEKLYSLLHPGQTLIQRLKTIQRLKKIGFQTGIGNIIGLPFQKEKDLIKDLIFFKEFDPDMIGTGPFIPQKDTPLAGYASPSLDAVLSFYAFTRIYSKTALIPATTAVATVDRSRGLCLSLASGCNVVMVNFTPEKYRSDYKIYDNSNENSLKDMLIVIEKAQKVACFSRGDSFGHLIVLTETISKKRNTS